jgi:hypothetical protein
MLLEVSGIVMKDIIRDVDFSKAMLLNKKIFIQMRTGFGSEYTHFLYHSEFGKREFFNKKWLTAERRHDL